MNLQVPAAERSTATLVNRPFCQMPWHAERGQMAPPALYDAATTSGRWGYLCETCFVLCTTHSGTRLGTGIGQFLLCGDDLDKHRPEVVR
jgi:hypothetical protein